MRINIRLIRVSQFLRLFRFNVRHKSNKKYIILDTLSRLASYSKLSLLDDYFELNVLYT